MRKLLVACAAMVLSVPITAVAQDLSPRDECAAVDGADLFLDGLAGAVAARDADQLVALSAPDILLDFGGSQGHEHLRSLLANTEYHLWEALERLLVLGCGSDAEQLFLPGYWGVDIGDEDHFEVMIVIAEDVPLWSSAGGDARQLDVLGWEIVTLQAPHDSRNTGLTRVKTATGAVGFVEEGTLRALLNYRLIAEKRDGKWKIRYLVAGD